MTFVMVQKVLFKHCDPAGIVFFPRYFEMMNDCVEAFFDEIGLPFDEMHRWGGVPTVKIATEFHSASRHGEMLDLALVVRRIGGASLDLTITTTCQGDLRMTYDATLVMITKDMKPKRWDAKLRTALETYLESEA